MAKILLFFIIGLLLLGLLAYFYFPFWDKTKELNTNKLQVTASFYPLYYFASEIAGDKAEIYNITPVGAEPHDYEPTAQDIARIQKSDLLIINGAKLESWGEKIKDQRLAIVIAGEDLAGKYVSNEGKQVQDPHVWLDPNLAKKEAEKILSGFVSVDPANGQFYQTNAKLLENKLDGLDGKYKSGLNSCGQKDFVTSHASFGYLADRYGLNQITISGVSPDEEPSSRKLAEIAKLIEEKNINYIFFESLISPKLAETIAQETGSKTLVLDPIEGIGDTDIKQGKNYFTQMEMNLVNLKTALQCQ